MVSNELEIKLYLHCGLCLEEWKRLKLTQKISPQAYQKMEVGWTEKGLQVWCVRHDCNVINIDFEGSKHPANITMEKKKGGDVADVKMEKKH